MDYEYAAGMVDADGCFGIHPKKRNDGTYSIRIYCKIDQKLKSYFLQEMSDEYSVTLLEDSRGQSRVTLCGNNAEHFAKRIRPHLIIKGPIVDYVLSLRASIVSKAELSAIRKRLKDLRDDNTIQNYNLTDRYFAGFIDGDGWLTTGFSRKTGYVGFKIGVLSHKSQSQAVTLIQQKYGGFFSYKNNGTNITWSRAITSEGINDFIPMSKHLRQKKERFDFIHSVVTEGANLKCNGATGESNAVLHSYFKSINCGQDT